MKRIYLLAYITILCCLCPLLKAQLGPMPFTPVPPNDPSLVRLLNSDVRCRQWVDSVMQRLTLKERIGQLFIYTIAPQQDKANKELLRKVVEDYKVGGLLFSGGLMQNQVMLTNYNPQIQISAESGTKRSIFRQKNKTKRSKKRLHTTLIKPEQKVNEDLCSGFIVS